MISNLPDWITAGTAITAVMGGLLGVYTSTQSRMDVTDERLANAIVVLESLSQEQLQAEEEYKEIAEKVVRSEVSAEYLRQGQERLEQSVDTLAGEVRQLNQLILSKHAK